jgi:hypothetical protein
VLDGEIVCLDAAGRSQFNPLLYRRGEPHYYAFDCMWLDGRDLRGLPLAERKQIRSERFAGRISRGSWPSGRTGCTRASRPPQGQEPELLAGRGPARAVRQGAQASRGRCGKPAVHTRFQSNRPWRPGQPWRAADAGLDLVYTQRHRRAREPVLYRTTRLQVPT